MIKQINRSLLLVSLSQLCHAQVTLNTMGMPYQQDFNTLISTGNSSWNDNSTLAGWYSSENTIYADDGNDVFGGRLHSYGSVNTAERALGGKSFSSLSGVAFAVRMHNMTGSVIDYFQVAFTGEQWRMNTNNLTLKFYYQLNASDINSGTWTPLTQFDFAALSAGTASALDGNLTANRITISGNANVTVNPNAHIWFKWEIIGDNSSPGLAIDDISITPQSNSTFIPFLELQSLTCIYDQVSQEIIIEPGTAVGTFELWTLQGRLVMSGETDGSRFYISTGTLGRGVYFVKLRAGEKMYAGKVAIY